MMLEDHNSNEAASDGLKVTRREFVHSQLESVPTTPLDDRAAWEDEKARTTREDPKGVIRGWRLYPVQACLLLCQCLSVMDSTIIATALVAIGRHFDDYVSLQWVVLSYLLSYLGLALVFARISDVIGRKWTTVVALVITLAFSLGAALAQSIEEVIAFRALQGVGGAGLYAMAFVGLWEITPPEMFAPLSSAPGLMYAVAAVCGPVIGGAFTSHVTWRWIFYFNVPYCGAVMLVAILVWPKVESEGVIKWHEWDLVGCVLFVASVLFLTFSLQEAGAGARNWNSATIIVCLVLAGVTAIALGFWIWYSSKDSNSIKPFFPADIITHRYLLGNFLVATLTGYIFYVVIVMLPQRFQIVNQKSPVAAGIDLIAVSGAAAVGAIVGGILSVKFNMTWQSDIAGAALQLIGCGLLSSIGFNNGHIPPRVYGFEVIVGFGFGLILASTTAAVKQYAVLRLLSAAQGLVAVGRVLGGNIGLAITTIVLNSRLVADLKDDLSSEQIHQLRQSLNVIVTFNAAEMEAVARAFSRGFQTSFQVCTGVAGLTLLAACLMVDRHAPRMDSTDEVKEAAV